jgi:hypothetical protein
MSAGRFRWREFLAGTAGVFFATHSALATEWSADLAVERADGAQDCPNVEALTARVERIRQAPLPVSPGAAAATVEHVDVKFSRTSATYAARLRFRGPKAGERQLEDRSSSCDALAEAVSLAIALSLDQAAEKAAAEAASERPPSAPTPPSRPVTPAFEKPSNDRSPTNPWALGIALESGAAFGFAPKPSWSVSARVQGYYRGFSLELGAHALLPATSAVGPAELRTTWAFADAGLCHTWGRGYAFGPCVLFAVGRARGQGVGFAEPRTATLSWLATGAGVILRGPIAGPAVWGLSSTLWVPLRKLTFSAENAGVVWRAASVSAMVTASAGVRFQ